MWRAQPEYAGIAFFTLLHHFQSSCSCHLRQKPHYGNENLHKTFFTNTSCLPPPPPPPHYDSNLQITACKMFTANRPSNFIINRPSNRRCLSQMLTNKSIPHKPTCQKAIYVHTAIWHCMPSSALVYVHHSEERRQ